LAGDELMNFTLDGPVGQPDEWRARLDLVERLATKPAGGPKAFSKEIKTETK
jgi:hypothetical protein